LFAFCLKFKIPKNFYLNRDKYIQALKKKKSEDVAVQRMQANRPNDFKFIMNQDCAEAYDRENYCSVRVPEW